MSGQPVRPLRDDDLAGALDELATHGGGRPTVTPLPRVLDPRDPLAIARRLTAERYAGHLHAWRGDLRAWTGTHYAEAEQAAVRAAIYEYLEGAMRPGPNGTTEPFRPNATAVNNVLDALRAAAHLDGAIAPPAWIDPASGSPPPAEIIAVANGLLHVGTRRLLPHTPAFFCTNALPFPWLPHAPEPVEFLRFLREVWPDDDEQVDTLQEMFGYLVSNETRQQKGFLAVGPKRSGKGTIARTLRRLRGEDAVAGPTLASLAGNFGLQSLIDRPVAIISDARLSGRTDESTIVERLLSITGEDVLTVDRKHREAWTGQLPTRFLILTNELPRLTDTSGAFASRFIVFTLTRSWYGREDVHLLERILPEMPGILRWALDGLDRLCERGHFLMPSASTEAAQEMEDLGSPVGAFVREVCVVEAGAEVDTSVLYSRWKRWCEDRGRSHVTTEQTFGRDLRAVVPGITTASRRSLGERWRVYVGLRPATEADTR